MAGRSMPELDPQIRAAMLVSLREQKRRRDREIRSWGATVRDALEMGFTTRELGEALHASASSVSRWSRDAA